MEPEGLLPTLPEPTTCPYTKPDIIITVRIKECIQFYYSHNIQHASSYMFQTSLVAPHQRAHNYTKELLNVFACTCCKSSLYNIYVVDRVVH